MYYWGREPEYILIECDKCGKVLKIKDTYFTVESSYVKPSALIQCKCGNSTLDTIYAKDSLKIQTQSSNDNRVCCPKCNSTQVQLVPRKWSLFTGFMTNKVDRVCINCKHKF